MRIAAGCCCCGLRQIIGTAQVGGGGDQLGCIIAIGAGYINRIELGDKGRTCIHGGQSDFPGPGSRRRSYNLRHCSVSIDFRDQRRAHINKTIATAQRIRNFRAINRDRINVIGLKVARKGHRINLRNIGRPAQVCDCRIHRCRIVCGAANIRRGRRRRKTDAGIDRGQGDLTRCRASLGLNRCAHRTVRINRTDQLIAHIGQGIYLAGIDRIGHHGVIHGDSISVIGFDRSGNGHRINLRNTARGCRRSVSRIGRSLSIGARRGRIRDCRQCGLCCCCIGFGSVGFGDGGGEGHFSEHQLGFNIVNFGFRLTRCIGRRC